MGVGTGIYPVGVNPAGKPGQWLPGIPVYSGDAPETAHQKLYSRGDIEP